jgi:hypothetical protein
VSDVPIGFADKVEAIHRALAAANVPHAFGGALALAYCIQNPRATGDIDVNVFVAPDHSDHVFAALPGGVRVTAEDREHTLRDGQVRLRWDATPIDFFFGYHPFHDLVARRVHVVPFGETPMPFLECTDLTVFKTIFGRPRDWVDIDAMVAAGTVDAAEALHWIGELFGVDDGRYQRLAAAFGAQPEEESEAESLHRAFGRPGDDADS